MVLLGVDPGFRHMGVVLVETNGSGKPHILKRATLRNGSISKWREGLPSLLTKLHETTGQVSFDRAGVEMISWYGKRRGSLQLAHLAGAVFGFLHHRGPVQFYSPKEVKTTSEKFGAPKGFDEHQTDALSICRLLADIA